MLLPVLLIVVLVVLGHIPHRDLLVVQAVLQEHIVALQDQVIVQVVQVVIMVVLMGTQQVHVTVVVRQHSTVQLEVLAQLKIDAHLELSQILILILFLIAQLVLPEHIILIT